MTAALRKPMTLAEFLEWEEQQELRYEFDGIQIVAMTGGTAAHSAIQRNVAVAVGGRLRGRPRQFYGNDLKIETGSSIRYPDGFVVCSPVPRRTKLVRDPVVIFEVLSDSTARIDMTTKNREYANIPSVRRYVVLLQEEIGATVFERTTDDWVGHLLGADAVLRMPEIGIEVPLVEFYEGIEFEPEAIEGQVAL